MIIAVERGLPQIKKHLESLGYKTFYADTCVHSYDVYVYAGHSPRGALSMIGGFDGHHLSARASRGARGGLNVVEINAADKSFEEIEFEISRQRRPTLF